MPCCATATACSTCCRCTSSPLAAAPAEGKTGLCRVAERGSSAQAQLGDLQRTAGVSEAVVDAARCIWLGLVAESGVVGPDFPRCVSASEKPRL